jgi:competence protein ComEC
MAFSLAFLAGVMGALLSPGLPAVWVEWAAASIALGGCALAILLRLLNLRNPFTRAPLNRTFIVTLVCGLAVGYLHAELQARSYLTARWQAEQRVFATVTIDTIPSGTVDSLSFDGIATITAPTPVARSLRVRLLSRAPEVTPHVGDRWNLLLTLRPPRGRVNPGAPDFERVLFRERIHALGTVISSSTNRRIDTGHRPLDRLRERIAAHIDAHVVDRDASALISALAVGVTGAVSREQWRVFNATGTTHLVAISGLHVTLFAVVAFAVARAFWSTVLYRLVQWRRENFAAAVGFAAAACYAALAGLSVPTQRTLIMLGAWLFTRAIARETPPFHSFALALVLVLALDPFAPLSAGFWLSFIAMAAIILVTSTRFVRRPVLLEALTVQGLVTLALIPLTLAAFGSVSVAGPLVNLIAIPAMSWIFVPTILLSIVLMPISSAAANAVLGVAAWMHEAGWPWLAAAADLPWAIVHASPPLWWYAIAVPGVVLSLMPWPGSLRLAFVICSFPLALATHPTPVRGGVDITMLDVGDGTSVVIQTAQHVLVYEIGEVYGTGGRTVDNVLVPVLRNRGLRRIDALVLRRLTPINAPGVTALLAEYTVDAMFVVGPPADLPGSRDCATDHTWEWDGVRFRTTLLANVCALAVETSGFQASFSREIDLRPAGARWAVVAGRRHPEGSSDQRVLATADLGAIRFRIDPEAGIDGPIAARAERRALWRSP